jgi:hypothetical protein
MWAFKDRCVSVVKSIWDPKFWLIVQKKLQSFYLNQNALKFIQLNLVHFIKHPDTIMSDSRVVAPYRPLTKKCLSVTEDLRCNLKISCIPELWPLKEWNRYSNSNFSFYLDYSENKEISSDHAPRRRLSHRLSFCIQILSSIIFLIMGIHQGAACISTCLFSDEVSRWVYYQRR